eukprot:gene25233-biopygen17990
MYSVAAATLSERLHATTAGSVAGCTRPSAPGASPIPIVLVEPLGLLPSNSAAQGRKLGQSYYSTSTVPKWYAKVTTNSWSWPAAGYLRQRKCFPHHIKR